MSHKAAQDSPKLERRLTLLDATMIVVGSMIGSGIFLVSAESARLVGAPGWLLLAWILAGVMTITGALSLGELAAMMPNTGGPYIFLRRAYNSPCVGFVYGWSQFLIIQTGTIAAVAVAFANFSGVFFPQISGSNYLLEPKIFGSYAVSISTQQLLAVAVIVLLTFVNTHGLKTGKTIQNIFTFTKTAALFGLVALGLTIGLYYGASNGAALFASDWWNSAANGWDLQKAQPAAAGLGAAAFLFVFGRAMTGPLFSQSAWDNVTFTAGEIENPGKNLPRALLIGCLAVVGLYVLANLAYVATLPLADIQNPQGNRLAAAMMNQIFGAPGILIIAAAIMISTFGCNNGLIMSGARVTYAMARDRLFFSPLARTNKHHVPAVALVVQCVWACLLVLPRTVTRGTNGAPVFGDVYSQLLQYIVSVDLVLASLSILAVIVLRFRAPNVERPYRTWGYPAVPIIFLALSSFLIVTLAILSPETAGIGYLLGLTGIPVYFIWRRKGKANETILEPAAAELKT